jgi:hypothetical protein
VITELHVTNCLLFWFVFANFLESWIHTIHTFLVHFNVLISTYLRSSLKSIRGDNHRRLMISISYQSIRRFHCHVPPHVHISPLSTRIGRLTKIMKRPHHIICGLCKLLFFILWSKDFFGTRRIKKDTSCLHVIITPSLCTSTHRTQSPDTLNLMFYFAIEKF